jgi:hypothetical protein
MRVADGKVERLRAWLEEVGRRREEALETLARETVRHEAAWLLETSDGPIVVYAIEAEDLDEADRAFADSPLPIDHEHRAVMSEVAAGPAPAEQLLDLRR